MNKAGWSSPKPIRLMTTYSFPFWPFLLASYTVKGVRSAEEARKGDGRQIPVSYLQFYLPACLPANRFPAGDEGPQLWMVKPILILDSNILDPNSSSAVIC